MPGNKEKVEEYKAKAIALLEKCQLEFPENVLYTKGNVKYSIAYIYKEAGDKQKAEKNLSELYDISKKELSYYLKFSGSSKKSYYMRGLAKDAFDTMERC